MRWPPSSGSGALITSSRWAATAGWTVAGVATTTSPAPARSADRDARLAAPQSSLQELDGLLVAFSGGADSAFLLAAAARALGPDRVVAATAVSPSLAADELPAAQAFAASLGVRHVTPETDELSREGYVANGADRCFHCKATLLDTLRPNGALCFVGVPDAPLRLDVGSMLGRQLSVTTSAIGGRPAIREMLEFAARHGIAPKVQLRPLAEANEALAEVRKGRARYRVVLAV